MPYNNTPIAPPTDVTGATSLPLARVKKIITSDPDISNCSNNAAFLVTVATEMFLQYLVEQTHNVVRSDRTNNNKPRRNLQYRDVANAVARIDNLEFLSDVVPKTMTFKALKEKEAKEGKTGKNVNGVAGRGASMNGQRTLDGRGALADDDAVDERAEQGEDVGEEVSNEIAEEMRVDDSAPGKRPKNQLKQMKTANREGANQKAEHDKVDEKVDAPLPQPECDTMISNFWNYYEQFKRESRN